MIRPPHGLAAFFLGFLLACGSGSAPAPARAQAAPRSDLPQAAVETLIYLRAHHQAPPGFEGGRRFGNYERRLPELDTHGRRIAYQEWDIHPHLEHRNRGAERLITGSDGRAWFTADHYQHFTEAKGDP